MVLTPAARPLWQQIDSGDSRTHPHRRIHTLSRSPSQPVTSCLIGQPASSSSIAPILMTPMQSRGSSPPPGFTGRCEIAHHAQPAHGPAAGASTGLFGLRPCVLWSPACSSAWWLGPHGLDPARTLQQITSVYIIDTASGRPSPACSPDKSLSSRCWVSRLSCACIARIHFGLGQVCGCRRQASPVPSIRCRAACLDVTTKRYRIALGAAAAFAVPTALIWLLDPSAWGPLPRDDASSCSGHCASSSRAGAACAKASTHMHFGCKAFLQFQAARGRSGIFPPPRLALAR